MDQRTVTVVSGLPRSGTSLMMKMLEAGGMNVLIDNVRQADEDNPRGYYEFERVKQIKHDQAWLEDAQGKAVKMVSGLLMHLPGSYTYKIIFVRRKMEEVLASQRKMLVRRGESPNKVSDEKMAASFRQHLTAVEAWLATQPNIDVINVSYNEILQDPPGKARLVDQFLGNALDEKKMADAVDPILYRQRR